MHLKHTYEVTNPQDRAVFDIIDTLIEKGRVSNVEDFCLKVGMHKQAITEIYKDMRHFNVRQIGEVCKVFNVNANYIFGLSTTMFRRVK